MTPTKITDCSRSIGKPLDWNEATMGPCDSLDVVDIDGPHGNVMVSIWSPTYEEAQILMKGGAIQLHVHGIIHPAVAMVVQK